MRVAVPGLTPAIPTGLVEPKLKVGEYCAPAGLDERDAVRATLPVKPPAGVTVMVDVFPVVAPGATETDEVVRAKLDAVTVVTVTEFDPVAVL